MSRRTAWKSSVLPSVSTVCLLYPSRDEFGMREDYHLVNNWRYLGTVHDEAALYELIENRSEGPF